MNVISRKEALALGLKFYFTGQPCKNGHLCEREVEDWKCLECRRARAAKRLEANRAEVNAARREKYAKDEAHRETLKAKARQWGAENTEKVSIRGKAWREANREHVLAVKKSGNAIRRARPEVRAKEREMGAAWNRANPEKKRSYVRNRRARKRNAEGSHTDKDIQAIWDRQGGMCVYCPADLRITGHHVDHIVPLSRGGSNWPSNLQCLCPDCNLRKWSLSEEEFLAKQKGPHG